jgi:hypothetical protein
MLGVVILSAMILFYLLWLLGIGIKAEVYLGNAGRHSMNFLEYAFCVLGAIDGDPETQPVYAFYSAIVRLAGAILIGGVITSFLCTLLDRYSDMTLRGLMYRKLSGHTIIVGYGMITDDFIRRVLEYKEDFESWYPDRPLRGERKSPSGKVLLYTSDDIIKVREAMANLLPKDMVKNIEFVSGEMDLFSKGNQICERLCLLEAQRVFILGDFCDAGAGELRNLNLAGAMAGYIHERREDGLPFPIYVQMESSCSFDLVKKMDYSLDTNVMLIPFSFSEGWARAVWGDLKSKYEPLEFRPLRDGDYVHLVIGGLSDFGRALAIEAIRIAHYASGEKTHITLVDPQPARWWRLAAAFPGLQSLPDIDLSYVEGDLQMDSIRETLALEAKNPHCLLTVAVCDDSPDIALETALNLPREVYPESQAFPPESAPRILVRQEHQVGFLPKEGTRYEHVQPFGWQEQGVPTWCLQRHSVLSSLCCHMNKDWEKMFESAHSTEYIDTMRKDAFEEYKTRKPSTMWANVYTVDNLQTVLRQLNLKAVRPEDVVEENEVSLSQAKNMLQGPRLRDFARAEHNRWVADRVLMGYLPHPTKDDAFRWHNCLVGFEDLSEEDVHKDERSLQCRLFTLAIMGYKVVGGLTRYPPSGGRGVHLPCQTTPTFSLAHRVNLLL